MSTSVADLAPHSTTTLDLPGTTSSVSDTPLDTAPDTTLDMDDLRWKSCSHVVKQETERKFTFVFSSGNVDRDNDIVSQKGIDLTHFKKNPVVLWSHDHRTPPIGRVVDMWFRKGSLMGTVEFPPEGASALADEIHSLVAAGFINAVSIGFRVKEWTFNEERGGYDFKSIELYELSIVPIGSNRDALRTAKAKGLTAHIEKWAKLVIEPQPAPAPDDSTNKVADAAPDAISRYITREDLADVLREILPDLLSVAAPVSGKGTDTDAAPTTPPASAAQAQPLPAPAAHTPAPIAQKVARPMTPQERASQRASLKSLAKSTLKAVLAEQATEAVRYHTGQLED